jgi:predicted dehydrogenase
LQSLSRLLSEGAIGRPLSVRAIWGEYLPGWHPWEDYRQSYSARPELGGGVILTLCHPFDYLRWLLGEVSELWAQAGHIGDLEIAVEDTAEIVLRFSNGAFGSLHLDYNRRPPLHTLEVTGSLGVAYWDNADGSLTVYRANPWEDGQAPGWKSYPAPPDFERNDMFLEEMRHFIAVVRGETHPSCPLSDGKRVLELALAAHASSSDGCMIRFNN